MTFFRELKRRNVLRVAMAYAVAAWLLIQVAETVFPLFGFDDTPARVVVIVLAIAFIPTLIFAWAFEWTPEGLTRDKDVDRSQSITPQTGKKLDRMIMVVLALALGYFGFDKFVLTPGEQARQLATATEQAFLEGRTDALAEEPFDEKSIAVLPFVNMSSDSEQEYFSDGISEELINLLTKIPELRVIARTSAFSYKGKDTRLSQVAEELNVNHILEGSVRKAGNRIRIKAQLIEAATEAYLWSETYERTLADIFTIQDEIAAQVVEQLKITLLDAAPTIREVDPEAYALRMQANYLLRDYREDSWRQAFDLFEQALAIEPDYAAAKFGLITKQYVDVLGGRVPYEEGSEKIRRALNEVLELDPDDGSVLAMLSFQALSDYDLVAAAAYLRRAMELEPDSWTVLQRVAELLVTLDRLDEAFMVYKHMTVLDPLNHEAYADLGWVHFIQGRMQEALDSFHTARLIKPEFPLLDLSVGNVFLLQGEAQAALEMFSKVSEDDSLWHGQKLGLTAMALHTLGRQNEYQATLSELIERPGNQQPVIAALVYAWAGDADTCFEWLDKAVDQHSWSLNTKRLSPEFDSIRDDPRWKVINERIGRSPEKIAEIEFDVSLPE